MSNLQNDIIRETARELLGEVVNTPYEVTLQEALDRDDLDRVHELSAEIRRHLRLQEAQNDEYPEVI